MNHVTDIFPFYTYTVFIRRFHHDTYNFHMITIMVMEHMLYIKATHTYTYIFPHLSQGVLAVN